MYVMHLCMYLSLQNNNTILLVKYSDNITNNITLILKMINMYYYELFHIIFKNNNLDSYISYNFQFQLN